jgi:hypothetical protein
MNKNGKTEKKNSSLCNKSLNSGQEEESLV